jgi:protein TonB
MQYKLPDYRSGHIVAIAGVLILHTGLAAWAMMPEPPAAMPEQQVIQVNMVAPTVIKQDVTPTPVKKEISKVPPKETGMAKVEPEQEIHKTQAQTKLTSGLQSEEASDLESAITEPVAASYLKNQPPKYPASARKTKQQGTVLLEIRVSSQGDAKSVAVEKSSGFEVLDEAAIEAVKQWKFIPARRGSSVVEANVIVPIEFKINS